MLLNNNNMPQLEKSEILITLKTILEITLYCQE